MKLYHKKQRFKSIQKDFKSLLKCLDIATADKIENLLNATQKPDLIGVDSLRFFTTANFILKLKRKFNLNLIEKSTNAKREIFANLGLYTAKIGTIQSTKLTQKITLQIYHTEQSIKTARKSKKALNSVVVLSLHGLTQYNRHGEIIRHKKAIIDLLTYLLQNATKGKKRKNITLKSFDLAFDYFEFDLLQGNTPELLPNFNRTTDHAKTELNSDTQKINKSYALAKMPFLKDFSVNFRLYNQTTLYIQTRTKPINEYLQKIVLYDKLAKSKAKDKHPINKKIIRIEYHFLSN
ncbi:MAG: hypothetical protein IJ211_00140 [Campylobacter sp.]|nr:hypothetical protein [Campylobacter sp.]